MKYLELFENYKIDKVEYPVDGYELSPREGEVLKDLVGDFYLDYNIKKDDGYYYTNVGNIYYNRFESFNDLKDYIQFKYFMWYNNFNEFLELLRTTKLDMSFDNNLPIQWASRNKEIVKLLLNDERVREKLSPYEIKFFNAIS